MGKIKRLAGETVLYGFGSIVPRFLNFLLVRLHTDAFVPEEYSVITKLFAYVAVINTLFMFGMETAYFRFANKPGADEKKVFNITLTVVIAISTLLSLIIVLMAKPIAGFLDIASRPDLVIWLALIMFTDAVVAIPFARLRLQKKAIKFAFGKVFNIIIYVGLNVYFLKLMPGDTRDVGWVVLANLIANTFYIVFFARSLLSWRPLYDRQLSPETLRYAYPVMLTGLAGITNEMFSRITLENWLPENFYAGKSTEFALGIFGAAYKFAVLMNLAIQGFRYAAEPFFFSNAAEKNSPQLFARVNHYFIIVCCILLIGVSINLDILKYFLAKPAYWEGLHIVPVLLLSYLLLGVYYNFSVWFKLTDRTYYGTIITIGGAIITVVANYLLIPIAGYEGSSWAALLCYLGMTVACYVLGQKFYPIPYDIAKSVAYIVVTLLIVYGVNAIEIEDQLVATGFHALVIGIYLAGIYLLERKQFVKKRA
ncbi:polysaccharide biosynthesis C-terminal domain-containing protein [Fulvivirgaceae bacterium PWU4]|uniref:Polysaccharide biosynthesis C-terminal domain-containing protein n=1 Tax=Chryseosolibacter histidini TaxID=2782349 RepID=A0AAP2DQC0_9BACT|nr:oligosaccharide flippase family protein [Chryseosolibacter histidini]MBT1700576.1 polysaccharide biosynthesis C-terminal domain-containing protein [Chryseosolibacter histidini]